MCLGVPGRLVERLPDLDGLACGVVEFAGCAARCAWRACPTPRSATTSSSTPGWPSAGSTPTRPGGCSNTCARCANWRRPAMKYLDEYRDPAVAETIVRAIRRLVSRPWTLMEVCGGQTHTLVKSGIDQ